ncbi:MAG: hypothetical protein ACUZ8O_13495 [Candidatus Anammoxibacter sp.]
MTITGHEYTVVDVFNTDISWTDLSGVHHPLIAFDGLLGGRGLTGNPATDDFGFSFDTNTFEMTRFTYSSFTLIGAWDAGTMSTSEGSAA